MQLLRFAARDPMSGASTVCISLGSITKLLLDSYYGNHEITCCSASCCTDRHAKAIADNALVGLHAPSAMIADTRAPHSAKYKAEGVLWGPGRAQMCG